MQRKTPVGRVRPTGVLRWGWLRQRAGRPRLEFGRAESRFLPFLCQPAAGGRIAAISLKEFSSVTIWIRFGVYVVLDRLRVPKSGCPSVSMTILFMPILRNCDPNKFTLK